MAQQFLSAEQADKWAFISNQRDGHSARARFNALKDANNLVIISETNPNRPEQQDETIFEVRPDGSAYAITREVLAEREQQRKKFAGAPKIAWTLKNGQEVKVWKIEEKLYVSINGGKRLVARIEAVPARDAKVAKENGIVAVLALSTTGNVALTAERKALLEQ